MRHSTVGSTLAAVLLAACATPTSPVRNGFVVDSAGVGAVRDMLSKALVAGDVAAVMAHYTDSATFVGQGTPTIANRGPMTDFLKRMYTAVTVTRFDIHPVRVFGHDGTLTETGIQDEIVTEPGKPPQEAWGRYMLTWVKSPQGEWQVAFDMAIDDSSHAVGKTP